MNTFRRLIMAINKGDLAAIKKFNIHNKSNILANEYFIFDDEGNQINIPQGNNPPFVYVFSDVILCCPIQRTSVSTNESSNVEISGKNYINNAQFT